MVSRQIHFFGFIGGSLLILFIVLFFGKEFYNQWCDYSVSDYELQTIKSDQIVMQKSALEDLAQSLNEQSDYMIYEDLRKAVDEDREKKGIKKPDLLIVDEELRKVTVSKKDHSLKQDPSSEQKEKPDPVTSVKRSIKEIMNSYALLQNRSYLNDEDKKVLDRIVSLLRPLKENIKVVVEGHTQSGLAPFISSDMAEATSKYLQESIPSLNIESIGYANRYPICEDVNDISNKRVEIIIRKRSGD